jgi:hypothetical protein
MKLSEYYKKQIKRSQIEHLLHELKQTDEVDFLINLDAAISLRIDDIKNHIAINMYAQDVMDKKIIELKNIQVLIKKRLDLEVFS